MGEKLLKERALTLVAEQMTASDAVGAGSAGAVAQALNDTPDLETSQLIRAALKLLAPKG